MQTIAGRLADSYLLWATTTHNSMLPVCLRPFLLELKTLLVSAGFDKKVLEAQEEEERERQRKKDRKRERRVSRYGGVYCHTLAESGTLKYQSTLYNDLICDCSEESDILLYVQREEEQEDDYEVDDEMQLALGFGGFGSSKR